MDLRRILVVRQAAALFALALVAACGGPRPDSPRAELEQRRGELQSELAADPKNIDGQVEMAQLSFRLGDPVAAEAAVRAAQAAGGQEPMLRPLLAKAFAMQGDGTRALQTLDGGPVAPEMQGEASWVAGNVFMDQGNLGGAQGAYDRAVREMPRESALWVDVARYRDANADGQGARDAIDYAIELNRNNSGALRFKANLIRTQEGLTASLKWYDAALEANPDNSDALFDRAATLGDLGRYKDMLASLRRAAELTPGDPRIFYLQSVLAARAGNYTLARSLLLRTRNRLDKEPSFMLLSAVVELELGSQALSATWSERLLLDQPQNFTARRLLAAAEWAGGDPDAAAAALTPIISRGDADSWSLLLAARVYSELGDDAAAAEYLSRGASLMRGEAAPFATNDNFGLLAAPANAEPLNPSKVIPAIEADMAQGNYASAVTRATRLRDANRGVADAHILLGDAALAAGRYDLAVQSFRAARNLDASERTTLRLANALFRAKDPAGSGAAIMSLRDSQPSSIAADRLAGHLAMDMRHWDEAIKHFERVRARIGNRDVVILRELARAWSAKKDPRMAMRFAEHAYRVAPQNADIMRLYAALKEELGDRQAALDLREKAGQIGK